MDITQWLQTLRFLRENQICLFCGGFLDMPAPGDLPLRERTRKSIKQATNLHRLVPQRYRCKPHKHPEDKRCIDEVSRLVGIEVEVHPACHMAFNRQYDKNGRVGFRQFYARMQEIDWGYMIFMPRGQP